MRKRTFNTAIHEALAQAMVQDPRIILFGEDSHMLRSDLFARFGSERILPAPISEAAFTGAAVGAAMAGLRPVVDLTLVDFVAVAMDPLLNHAAKLESFSGGRWQAPLVLRAACGGGYGDGGQHEQSLWGWLAHIPGLRVVVPSTPADAGGLMLAAIEHEGPVIFLEHKMLAENWLDWMGGSQRPGVSFDVPPAGTRGEVPDKWRAIPLGKAVLRRKGSELTMISLGLSVHRCLEAAERLQENGITAAVLDLRSVSPLDEEAIVQAVSESGRLLVVDEDYRRFGLSGEVAAVALEAGLNFQFARVCTDETIPFARDLEEKVLPNVSRIYSAALALCQ